MSVEIRDECSRCHATITLTERSTDRNGAALSVLRYWRGQHLDGLCMGVRVPPPNPGLPTRGRRRHLRAVPDARELVHA